MYFVIYKDAKSEFRWRLKTENNLIIADSAEGYTRKEALMHAIDLIRNQISPATSVIDVTT